MPGKILIIDDNPTNLKLAGAILSAEGFETEEALSAGVALESIRAHPPRLILLDLWMPGMDGFALAELLRNDPSTQGVIIVALTASVMADDQAKVCSAGFDGFIAKPFDVETFCHQVASYLPASEPASLLSRPSP